jgi:hypothetical protein
MTGQSTDGSEQLRERFPDDVYATDADFVKLAMKRMTARRMVGWLREYAQYADVAGSTKTAEHARHVADSLAQELPDEDVEEDNPVCYQCGETLGEDWKAREKRAKEKDEHPAKCPHCRNNPLPPVGGESA